MTSPLALLAVGAFFLLAAAVLSRHQIAVRQLRDEREADLFDQLVNGDGDGGEAPSQYLTAAEAAEYLRFGTLHAFEGWRSRMKQAGFPLRSFPRGRKLLFKQSDLDEAVRPVRERTKVATGPRLAASR